MSVRAGASGTEAAPSRLRQVQGGALPQRDDAVPAPPGDGCGNGSVVAVSRGAD